MYKMIGGQPSCGLGQEKDNIKFVSAIYLGRNMLDWVIADEEHWGYLKTSEEKRIPNINYGTDHDQSFKHLKTAE